MDMEPLGVGIVAVGRILPVGEESAIGVVVPFCTLPGVGEEFLLFNGVDGQAAKQVHLLLGGGIAIHRFTLGDGLVRVVHRGLHFLKKGRENR